MRQYQLIVIGAGSGGLTAAGLAAKLGASVALVEASDVLGGDCLHTGCVPSKALIHAAREVWTAKSTPYLRNKPNVAVDFAAIRAHISSSIQHIQESSDNDERYRAMGVDIYHGDAEFCGKTTIRVGEQLLDAKRIIIATGSRPLMPDISGINDIDFLTNETIFNIEKLPESLTVIGGGPIGCELGQAFAMLGSKVTIIQRGSRLLPRDEPEVSAALEVSLSNMGITVYTDTVVKRVSKQTSGIRTEFTCGDEPVVCESEQLLLATGRKANLPHSLEKAGIKYTTNGVTVDDHLRTSQRHIYAVGDCNGEPMFTHTASNQAVLAVRNALFGMRKKFVTTSIPWVTFTTPEIAHFGRVKSQLEQQPHHVFRLGFDEIDKAVVDSETGFIEVSVDQKGQILGATIMGAEAGEILTQIVLLQARKIPLKDIASVMQAYPTRNFGVTQLAAEASAKALDSRLIRSALRWYVNLHTGKIRQQSKI